MSSYTVTSATVDPFNLSSSQLTAAWNISIYIKNYYISNDIYFDRVKSSIYYGYHLLAQVSMHHFHVLPLGDKTLKAHLMNHSESLDVDVAKSMVRERLLHGAVDFRVELLARANGYKYNISCENVTVGFPATHDVGPGVMLGPRRKCNVLVDGKTNNKGWERRKQLVVKG
ncbi:uncharacterized protein LOC131241414 [Magnolia sinica]|uniref:uncharacterized protein LOC131241414 n=1 Tax=Magnolia sinica TaxID=86752 RepID=UPI0026587750|nr:uncharacterized protein LOC131241414 [Magnolia sinica]